METSSIKTIERKNEMNALTGSQLFILVFMIGGVLAGGFFFTGLGIYYWGKNSGGNKSQDDQSE